MATADLIPLINTITEKLSIEESEAALHRFKSTFGERYNSATNICEILNSQLNDNRINPANISVLQECLVNDSTTTKDEILQLLRNFIDSNKREIELIREQESLLIRRNEIHDLADTALRNGHGLLLYGDHGVGKTCLAKDFLNQRHPGKAKEVDLREIRDTKVAAVEILRKFGYIVSLQLIDLNIFASYLSKTTKETILFLDNADDILNSKGTEDSFAFNDLLFHIVNAGKGHIKMLITSRYKSCVPEFNIFIRQEKVGHLEQELSVKLLKSFKLNRELNQEKLLRATELCQNLPINITLLGGILQDSGVSFDEIIQLVQRVVDTKIKKDQEIINDLYTNSFLDMSFDKLSDTLQKGAVAASLFCRPFTFEVLASILDTFESCKIHLLLNALKHVKLINVIEETTTRKEIMYDMHPKVRQFFQSRKNDDHLASFFQDTRTKFLRKFRLHLQYIADMLEKNHQEAQLLFANDYSNFEFVFSEHIELGIPLFENYHDLQVASDLIQLMFHKKWKIDFFQRLARCSLASGNLLHGALFLCHSANCECDVDPYKANDVLQKAKYYLDTVKKEAEKASYTGKFRLNEMKAVDSAYNEAQGLTYFSICMHTRKLEDNEKALEACQRSLSLREDLYENKPHLDLAYSLMDIGAIHNLRSELVDRKESRKQLDLALEFFTKAMKIMISINKSGTHVRMPTLLQNIGTVWQLKEKYKKAADYYNQALSMERKLKVEGFYTTATVMVNLANTYRDLNKHKKALEMAQQSVAIRIQLLGDHPKTVHSLYIEAVVNHEMRNYVDAIRIYQKAFEMDERLTLQRHSKMRYDIRSAMIMAYKRALQMKLTYLEDEYESWKSRFERMDEAERKALESKDSDILEDSDLDLDVLPTQDIDVGVAKMCMTSDGGLFEFKHLCVSLEVANGSLKNSIELELYRIPRSKVHMKLAFGESILSDVIVVGPDSVTFLKPATLRMPYNLFELPAMAEVVVRCHSVSEQRWISLPTTLAVDEGGRKFVGVRIDKTGMFNVCLSLKEVQFEVPQQGAEIYPFGGDIGIGITFEPDTFGTDVGKGIARVNYFSKSALRILQRLGVATSPVLHIDMGKFDAPEKPVTIELKLQSEKSRHGKLMILRGDDDKFTDITNSSNPVFRGKFQNVVRFQVCHFSVFAFVWTKATDAVKLLQTYVRCAVDAEFQLYAKQNPSRNGHVLSCCVACCPDDDTINAKEWFYDSGYKQVEKSKAADGIYTGTSMNVSVVGQWRSCLDRPLKLNLRSVKFCTTETFVMERNKEKKLAGTSQNYIEIKCEQSRFHYGSIPYWNLETMIQSLARTKISEEESEEEDDDDEDADEEEPPFRFLGLKMQNCRLCDVTVDYNNYSRLHNVGFSEQFIEDIKADQRGHISKFKMILERTTDYFRRGKLKTNWFEDYFEHLRNEDARFRIKKVFDFLCEPLHAPVDSSISRLLEIIYKAKYVGSFWTKLCIKLGKDYGYQENLGRRSNNDSELGLSDDESKCKFLLYDVITSADGGSINFLFIVKALLRTKYRFRESKKVSRCIQSILDILGSMIQEILEILDD